MTVSSFATDDLFVLRVVKSLSTNPDNKWVNSYEFQARAPGAESELLALADAVVQFERGLHITPVQFTQFIISTWAPDSKPYDPAAFISSPLAVAGVRAGGSDLLALSTTFSVARVCATGRFGHLFYRGVLMESEQVAPAGKAVLADKAAMQSMVEANIAAASMDDYMGTAPSGVFQLVLVSKDGTQVRPVVGLVVAGISQVPQDHAWFNRTASTP